MKHNYQQTSSTLVACLMGATFSAEVLNAEPIATNDSAITASLPHSKLLTQSEIRAEFKTLLNVPDTAVPESLAKAVAEQRQKLNSILNEQRSANQSTPILSQEEFMTFTVLNERLLVLQNAKKQLNESAQSFRNLASEVMPDYLKKQVGLLQEEFKGLNESWSQGTIDLKNLNLSKTALDQLVRLVQINNYTKELVTNLDEVVLAADDYSLLSKTKDHIKNTHDELRALHQILQEGPNQMAFSDWSTMVQDKYSKVVPTAEKIVESLQDSVYLTQENSLAGIEKSSELLKYGKFTFYIVMAGAVIGAAFGSINRAKTKRPGGDMSEWNN